MRGGIFIMLHTRNTLRERTVLRNVRCTPPPPHPCIILRPFSSSFRFLSFLPFFATLSLPTPYLCFLFEFLVLKKPNKKHNIVTLYLPDPLTRCPNLPVIFRGQFLSPSLEDKVDYGIELRLTVA
jgi:hypothetical protein